MKRCSTSYVIRETQIKAERPYHTTTRKAETQKTDNTSSGAGVEQQERSFSAGGRTGNRAVTWADSMAVYSKSKCTLTTQNCAPWYLSE